MIIYSTEMTGQDNLPLLFHFLLYNEIPEFDSSMERLSEESQISLVHTALTFGL